MDNLSTLEIIGLAFITGLKTGEIVAEADEEKETEKEECKCENKQCKDEEDNNENVIVGKIEGEDAKRLMDFIEKQFNNKEEK